MTWHISREEGAAATCDHDGCDARLVIGQPVHGDSLANRATRAGWVVHWPQAIRHSCPACRNTL